MSIFKIINQVYSTGMLIHSSFKYPVHKMKQNDPQIDLMGLTEPDTGLE